MSSLDSYIRYCTKGQTMDSLEIDTHLLIASIKKRNPLYDGAVKEYHDRALKKMLWDEVCEEVYSADTWNALSKEDKLYYGREIQRRWGSLRHCFRRELSAQKNSNATTSTTRKRRKKYTYFDALMFLSPHSDNGNGEPSPENAVEEVEVIVEIKEEPIDDNEPENPLDTLEHEDPPAKIRKTNTEGKKVKEEPSERVGDRMLTQNDDDDAFFRSLIPTMKGLTVNQKLLLRIEIMKTIMNFKKSHGIFEK